MAPSSFPRLKLRHILFLALLLAGTVPMLVSTFLLVPQNRDLLEDQERDMLVNEAMSDTRELTHRLVGLRRQLTQVGTALVLGTGGARRAGRWLREPWVEGYLDSLSAENPQVRSVSVLDRRGEGITSPAELPDAMRELLRRGFQQAVESRRPAYAFAVMPSGEPMAAVAAPVAAAGTAPPAAASAEPAPGPPEVVVVALLELTELAPIFRDGGGELAVALIGPAGEVLWSRDMTPLQQQALSQSAALRGFVRRPLGQLTQYEVEVDGERREMLLRLAPVGETGWALAAQRPVAAAFRAADELVYNTLLTSLLVVLLALVLAAVAARRVSGPVQKLADTSHEIAAGNFGQRVEVEGLTWELGDLAEDFNRMSGHVERYVEELKRAVQANRELFIGSLRAFAAAIDAKDPYTRGHSERVAAMSRTIARHLGLSEDEQHRIWIAALLHDVGKIGVDDRILKKGGVLTDDEFAQMKAHTVIGEEILTPIVDLREMLPAVRWHHENWNGRGYPDGLKGEQIPVPARIVAVADTFDAVTTNRPYQQAYSLDDAVATVRRLVGSRFDAKVVSAFLRAYERGEVRLQRRPRPPQRPAAAAPAERMRA
jgi:HD-GYP domain-containing protein (c-di-GMP phosphodiesterase class II)